jgi:hypothetical protein
LPKGILSWAGPYKPANYSVQSYIYGMDTAKQILSKSPQIVSDNTMTVNGIKMYIKNITEKKSPINIARYVADNYAYREFGNPNYVWGERTNWWGYHTWMDAWDVKDKAQGIFSYWLSTNGQFSFHRESPSGPYIYNYSPSEPNKQFINTSLCPDGLKYQESQLDYSAFFLNYVSDKSKTPADVKEVEYWEIELVDPTVYVSTPVIIPLSDTTTNKTVSPSTQNTSVSTQTVNTLLTSSIVPFDSDGKIPFDGYNSITSATYVIDADVNNSITIYERTKNRPCKRYLGNYPGELIIKSVPTTVNNKVYNINTLALIYTLNDSVKFGGTDDSLLLKEGIVPFGYGSKVQIDNLKLFSSQSQTDTGGSFLKYTDYNGTTNTVSIKTLLNNTYVHYVTRYCNYDNNGSGKLLDKEMIVLSQIKPDISILPSYLNPQLKFNNFKTQSISFTVTNTGLGRSAEVNGSNPFPDDVITLTDRNYINTIARYLGANYGDNVKLTIFPVGKAKDLIKTQFSVSSGFGNTAGAIRDKNNNLIFSLNFDTKKKVIYKYQPSRTNRGPHAQTSNRASLLGDLMSKQLTEPHYSGTSCPNI